jgi:hypothetical protein
MTTDFAKRISLKVAEQLPEFIRSETNYQTFVAFIQAYYEWMEEYNIASGKEGAIRGSQNLLNYRNIDFINPGETYNKFIDYYVNDFLPNFPKDALSDKAKLVKIAKELYNKKGTPASYEFLFRALYNSDSEIFLTREAVFKASDGKWYVSKSLRLASNDEQWLSTDNLRIFGNTSKSFATIERGLYVGNRIELYISNIQRLFESGELVTVVDQNNLPLYFKDSKIVPEGTSGSTTLTAKILGSISSVNINPQKRGQLYKTGDPVIFYGGLNSTDGVGAIAYVNEVTSGSIRAVDVIDGGYGYREDPNTYIRFIGGGGSGAIANVTTVDPAGLINVNFIPTDWLGNYMRSTRIGGSSLVEFIIRDYSANATIITGNVVSTTGLSTGDTLNIVGSNTNLNLNGTYTVTVANSNYFFINNLNSTLTGVWSGLANTGLAYKGTVTNYAFLPANTVATLYANLASSLSFVTLETYPIDTIEVNNGGGGFTSLPTVEAFALYDTLDPEPNQNLKVKGLLGNLGILGPIEIIKPGIGYSNGDKIVFTGGTGVGANANVTVNVGGSITSVEYSYSNTSSQTITYPKGGLGYRKSNLPTLSVVKSDGTPASGSGAELSISGILGDSAVLEGTPDERGIGAITSFFIENYGEDYISAPNVSLRVRDIVVKNVSINDLVKTDEIVYQGSSLQSSVFRANVASINLLESDGNPLDSKYILRVYNYTSNTKTDLQLKVTDRLEGLPNLYLDLVTSYETFDPSGSHIFKNGIRTYGNGAAIATARFLNGLIVGQGQYLNDDGFPSSFQVLENEDYNSFSYQLIVEKSFSAYKEILYSLLHPSGTKVIPINLLKANSKIDTSEEVHYSNTHTLYYYTGNAGTTGNFYASFDKPSNNIIKFIGLSGANLSNIMPVGTTISLTSQNGPNVISEIYSVNDVSGTAVIKDNVFLSFANVATANVTVSNNRINILSFTNQYDLINNGEYSNNQNKLLDIAYAGDNVFVSNGVSEFYGHITYVSYANGVIFANTTIPFSSNTANVSIRRNLTVAAEDVLIYNYLGQSYDSELVTQGGQTLITQSGDTLIIG